MDLNDFLSTEAILVDIKETSKKQILQKMTEHAAKLTSLDEQDILKTLLQREKLGSTSIGQGVAIPHAKLSGLTSLTALFARLYTPVDFEAKDGQLVDIVCVLLTPENRGAEHLKALTLIAKLLRNPETAKAIRQQKDARKIHTLLTADSRERNKAGTEPLKDTAGN
ncbi:MAG: PTS sugar transporter subunit IIA [Alphaproteobacteria bacterium]|nr:PTS sugar transporter subunit IIA [Alphaproteobacteria bacterium]